MEYECTIKTRLEDKTNEPSISSSSNTKYQQLSVGGDE